MSEPDPLDAELRELSRYARLAERLKQAHALVRGLELPPDTRADLVRQVLVITAVAKHDPATAARRLDRFLRDLSS